ncbi:hypothetical protein LOD99_16170 [Oopsacas minuta]|uniref:Uncharacterized protein n=1 Tax=Oopsacas minuta TaxID=111878 RepID=A0AAV7K6E1_9METZ|nr:hypothetical protein LOD99_16170 [Oopsacas minuta]
MRSLTIFSFLLLIAINSAQFVRFSLPESSITYFICQLHAPSGLNFSATVPSLSLNSNDNYFYFDEVDDHLDPLRYHGYHIPDFSLEMLSGFIQVMNFQDEDFENISCFQYLNDDTLMQHHLSMNYLLQPGELTTTTPVVHPSDNLPTTQLPISYMPPTSMTNNIPESQIWKYLAISLAVILILFLCCCVVRGCIALLLIFSYFISILRHNSCSYDARNDGSIAPSLIESKILVDTAEHVHVELGDINPLTNSHDPDFHPDDRQEDESNQT